MEYKLSQFCTFAKCTGIDTITTLDDLSELFKAFKDVKVYGMEDLYAALGPIIGQAAKQNTSESEKYNRDRSLAELLKGAFIWHKTAQGETFWRSIYEHLKRERL